MSHIKEITLFSIGDSEQEDNFPYEHLTVIADLRDRSLNVIVEYWDDLEDKEVVLTAKNFDYERAMIFLAGLHSILEDERENPAPRLTSERVYYEYTSKTTTKISDPHRQALTTRIETFKIDLQRDLDKEEIIISVFYHKNEILKMNFVSIPMSGIEILHTLNSLEFYIKALGESNE